MSGPVSTTDSPAAPVSDTPERCDVEVLEGRESEVGGFAVRRVLPRRARPTIAPGASWARGTWAATTVPLDPNCEYAIVAVDGVVAVGPAGLEPGRLGYLGTGRDEVPIDAEDGTRVLLLGGTPFPEPLLMWWNYVARTRDEITTAHRDWTNDAARFGRVASPLPRVGTQCRPGTAAAPDDGGGSLARRRVLAGKPGLARGSATTGGSPCRRSPSKTAQGLARLSKLGAKARQRPIRQVTEAPKGYEGEGFPVRRAFAGVDLAELDPFIHLDQIGEVNYAPGDPKGTPWHPHRGFETVTT